VKKQTTLKKIKDARKKGQVAHSKDLVSTALLVAVYGLFFAYGYQMIDDIKDLILLPTHFYELPFREALKETVQAVLDKSITIVLPFIILVIITGIFANVVQVGPLFSLESIKPDIKKINPIEGFKKIFAMKNLVELIKSIFKIVFLSGLIYWVIRSNINDIIKLPYCGSACILPFIGNLMFQIAIVSIIAFVIVGFVDLIFQRYDHTKKLKMTKDEVKREYKDSEGNPEMKSERKQIHKDMLEGGMIEEIKKSSVVVTNPTHFAVGIEYDEKNISLPIITIKGANRTAQRIKRIAAKEGIPMVENVPLARALYADGELNNYVPTDLIEPVAEVLKWVKQLNEEKSDSFEST
jgi:type III secretion protein U